MVRAKVEAVNTLAYAPSSMLASLKRPVSESRRDSGMFSLSTLLPLLLSMLVRKMLLVGVEDELADEEPLFAPQPLFEQVGAKAGSGPGPQHPTT